MTRATLLLGVLVAVAPVRSQTAPTSDEIERMEQAVAALRDDSSAARRAFNRTPDGRDRLAAQDSARSEANQVNVRLRDARADLATARERAEVAPDAAPRDDTLRASADTPAAEGASDPWYTAWPVIALLVALLALAGAGAWWFTQRRASHHSGHTPRASRPALTGAEQQQRLGAQGAPPLFASAAKVEALERQVEKLQKDLGDMQTWATDYFNRNEAQKAAPVAVAPAAPAAPALSPADGAAAAFADWCRRATPMMSRVDFFAADLGARVPGASARAVYRDLNSQAEPVRFDAAGGASPAEFWLVTAGGEALLFPQPLNAHQFRDLTRVFDGAATPASLRSIAPARVRDEGAAHALTAPGRVS